MAENKLTRMGFILTCDRPIDPDKHYLSPGGYILNGKQFDFCDSSGEVLEDNPFKVCFEMRYFDDDVANEEDDEGNVQRPITKTDIERGAFEEFFIYTGEDDDEPINVVAVEDIWFIYDEKCIKRSNSSRTTKSANECIREQFAEA